MSNHISVLCHTHQNPFRSEGRSGLSQPDLYNYSIFQKQQLGQLVFYWIRHFSYTGKSTHLCQVMRNNSVISHIMGHKCAIGRRVSQNSTKYAIKYPPAHIPSNNCLYDVQLFLFILMLFSCIAFHPDPVKLKSSNPDEINLTTS